MKISYNWLKTYLSLKLPPEKLADLLTHTGLEVNHFTPFELLAKELVIGQVLTCAPHPHADQLQKTTVDVGGEHPLNIICGAPNVAAGQKVIVAPVGTTLKGFNGDLVFELDIPGRTNPNENRGTQNNKHSG